MRVGMWKSLAGLLAGVAASVLAGCSAGLTTAPPVAVAAANAGSPPVLEQITQKTTQQPYDRVFNEFHFHDADGDVRFIHRELVDTNGPHDKVVDGVVNLPAAMQKRGAIFTGAVTCGPNRYYMTMRAYFIDEAGNHSNTMEYTVHCNGG